MIGERLFTLRKNAKLSQEELGKILKINKHSVSAYEKEKKRTSLLMKSKSESPTISMFLWTIY